MKLHTRILHALPLLALAACSTTAPVPEKYRFARGDAATGALRAQQPASQYEVLEELPMEGSGSATRIPETRKAYAVRRYVDPVDKRILHERGVIYRVEQDARWNLAGTPREKSLLGPVVGVREPHYVPAPLGSEVATELAKQKALSKALTTSVQNLATVPTAAGAGAGERLVQAAGRIEEGQRKVLSQVTTINQDLAGLRERVEALERDRRETAPAATPQRTESAPAVKASLPGDSGLQVPQEGGFNFLKR